MDYQAKHLQYACFWLKLFPCSYNYEILETIFQGVVIACGTLGLHIFSQGSEVVVAIEVVRQWSLEAYI